MTVSPAYGRDYKSAKDAADAWLAGKDFILESVSPWMGKPCSIRNTEPGDKVSVRYAHKRKVTIVTTPKE